MCLKNKHCLILIRLFAVGIICLILFIEKYNFVHAADMGSCGENLTWSLSNGILTIYGSGDMLEYSDGAFPGWYGKREEIRTIVLPTELTSISDFAFFGCNNVTSVALPSSITYIGDYAFAQCTSLLQVDLGTGVQIIGEGAFQECESLLSVSFPPSLTSIGAKGFYRCDSLQTLTIPDTVESIGSSAFAYCSSLVRATVNASVEILPNWTFYGCDSLADVSLAPSIVYIGEFAFQLCENLNGIYTQSGDVNTAYKLEKSISETDGTLKKGVVGTYEMPDSSIVTKDDGKVFSETKVTQFEGTVVSVEKATDYSQTQSKTTTVISALVDNSEDWANVVGMVDEIIANADNTPITVDIKLMDSTVEAGDLAQFAGKAVILQITTSNGVIWQIDMEKLSAGSFSGSYNLSVEISKTDRENVEIDSDQIYFVGFSDYIDFNVRIGIKEGTVYELVTLYQRNGKEYEAVETIVVDTNGYAWFSLANIDKGTDYYTALNVEDVTMEEAVVPTTMFEQYELDGESHLMDEDGVTYKITGRTSKWGITGKQFAMYVAVIMIAVVLIVAIIMTSMNIIKRSKEKYQHMQEEAEIDEEALRMEVIREMLGKKDVDSTKK